MPVLESERLYDVLHGSTKAYTDAKHIFHSLFATDSLDVALCGAVLANSLLEGHGLGQKLADDETSIYAAEMTDDKDV